MTALSIRLAAWPLPAAYRYLSLFIQERPSSVRTTSIAIAPGRHQKKHQVSEGLGDRQSSGDASGGVTDLQGKRYLHQLARTTAAQEVQQLLRRDLSHFATGLLDGGERRP
jgi:hypothetical protein